MKFDLSGEDRKRMDEHLEKIIERTYHMIGYPLSRDFDYSEMNPAMRYALNNIGDPRIESTSVLSTKHEENEVVDFFARLFRAPENNY